MAQQQEPVTSCCTINLSPIAGKTAGQKPIYFSTNFFEISTRQRFESYVIIPLAQGARGVSSAG
jgi:hypothetical protein